MNILFLIEADTTTQMVSPQTIESIEKISKEDLIRYYDSRHTNKEQQLYFQITEIINNQGLIEPSELEDIDYIMILPNGATVEENFREIIEEYITEVSDNKIYLPFCLLTDIEEKEKVTKGILNSSIWTDHAIEIGKLDHELALHQTDTVLYGALVPKKLLLDKTHYNVDLKYYQHYHFFNSVTSIEDNEVIGIPKILSTITYDLTFKNVDKDEKVSNYKLAREKFVKVLNEQQ